MRILLTVLIVSLTILAHSARADDPRFDSVTGRNLANYPTSVFFDHTHLKIDLVIPDIETPRFTAVATLTASPVGTAQSSLTLNARSTLTFNTIKVNGEIAGFVHADGKLSVTLSPPAQPGESVTVEMSYAAENPFSAGSGLNWFKTRPGREAQGAIVYSQGQPNFNSYWFPCHDAPNELLTTEIVCTVDSNYEVISNGRLLSKENSQPIGERPQASTTWHWKQNKPHASYLVMLAIGKFDRIELNPDQAGLSMPVYGPVGSGKNLETIFANTPEMVTFYGELFDEPYPWDKYAQVIVRNFRWGGMENTSATVLAEYAASGGPRSQDDLIAHELVHQWWGNMVTCKNWEHLWINEGWATFGEWLWVQKRDGDAAYYRAARQARGVLRLTANETAPKGIPMVSKYYGDPDDNFTKAENPYTRGGFFLHMLRERLGDQVFWKGARLFLDRYKFSPVETDDFRKVMEEVSGQSLERFFDQWAKRPSMPTLRVRTQHDGVSGKLTVTVEQTQPINAENPAYALRLPIYCELGEQQDNAPPAGKWVYVDTDSRSTTQSFELPAKPSRIRIDPNATLLARFDEPDSQGTQN